MHLLINCERKSLIRQIVEDQEVTFDVDTEAAVTILSKKDYESYFKNSLELTSCELNLQEASGNPLSVLGRIDVGVMYPGPFSRQRIVICFVSCLQKKYFFH